MRSPPLLVIISHYSIPAGMLGRGLNKYQSRPADARQRPLRSRCRARLTRGVRLQASRQGQGKTPITAAGLARY